MPKVRRPCPRELYDGCPIPRELCSEDYEKTVQWHCLKLLKEMEMFLFGSPEEDGPEYPENYDDSGEVTTLEDLMRVLACEDRED